MKKVLSFLFIFIIIILISGCATNKNNSYILSVYNTSSKTIEKLNLEEYIEGVVAGEIYNNWNIEVLKAQAILARTFTIHFLKNNKSKYNNADISTDILEAQAYNKENVNTNIKKAVQETKGIILTCNNETIYPYYHSNSGGITASANTGLSINNLDYIKIVESPETLENSKNFSWNSTILKSDILNKLKDINFSVTSLSSITKGKIDNKRLLTINIGGKEISANLFRKVIGTTIIKSTYITNITTSSNSFTFSGLGYGHGVGLSQWGAKILADQGYTYKDIINFYFSNISFTNIYNK